MKDVSREQAYIYTFAYNPEETELCMLEMRAMFGEDTDRHILKSGLNYDPSRSPFMKERIAVLYEADSLEEMGRLAGQLDVGDHTFKVQFVKINDLPAEEQIQYQERLAVERMLGWKINGEADVRNPDLTYGIVSFRGRWYFGPYCKAEPVWLHHLKKPREYSTALSTRLARAAVNIAVPQPEGKKVIDPCCGIGTVLVEALSMGVDILGRDMNPLVTGGSRENIAHFGYEGQVELGPIAEAEGHFDAAVIDMPYNLYTHATPEQLFDILFHARRIADRAVIITSENMDEMIKRAGFAILDRCEAKKGTFSRQLMVCE